MNYINKEITTCIRGKSKAELIGNQAFLQYEKMDRKTEYMPVQRLEETGVFRKEAKGVGKTQISYVRPGSDDLMASANDVAAMPENWRKTANEQDSVNFGGRAYHHVIPFNMLAKFWDALVENGDIDGFRKIMTQVMHMHFDQAAAGRTARRTRPPGAGHEDEFYTPNRVGRVKANDMEEFMESITEDSFKLKGMDEDSDGKQRLELLASMFTWMPFNLVHGKGNRPLDPHEEFDQTAAVMTGKPELYRALMNMMNAYRTKKAGTERDNLINAIEAILKVQVNIPVKEFGESMESRDGEIVTEIKEALTVFVKQMDARVKTMEAGKAKKQEEGKTNRLKKMLAKAKLDMGELQHAFTELLQEDSIDMQEQAPYMERMQRAVDDGREALGGGFSVEYGSGRSNNCFFAALSRLGFHTDDMGTVEAMREQMNALRHGIPGYHQESMINMEDAGEFATHFDIIVHVYTVEGGHLRPGGVLGTNAANGEYYVLHQGLHFMPMIQEAAPGAEEEPEAESGVEAERRDEAEEIPAEVRLEMGMEEDKGV